MNDSSGSMSPAPCDNCGTVLQGGYCHVCGQRAHNPLHSMGHAVEEVVESFWHLDGRIFRTLRDLLIPGRVAAEFLAGKRARYIPPLRLFLILSLLTFFIGKLTVHVDPQPVRDAAGDGQLRSRDLSVGEEGIRAARTVDELLKARASALQELDDLRADPFGKVLLTTVGPDTERQMHESVRQRLSDLHATPEQFRAAGYDPVKPWTPDAQRDDAAAATAAANEGFLEHWFRKRIERAQRNAAEIRKDPDTLVRLILEAVPGALLMLVPVFALCLKLLYIRSRRGYLEHLVVALYSHVAMLGVLMLVFLALGLGAAVGGSAMAVATNLFGAAMFGIVVPVYLWLMQKRVYAQGWLKTTIKYAIVGNVYSVLLGCALLYAVLAGVSS